MLVPDPFARPEPAEFTLGEALERLSARHQAPFTAPTTPEEAREREREGLSGSLNRVGAGVLDSINLPGNILDAVLAVELQTLGAACEWPAASDGSVHVGLSHVHLRGGVPTPALPSIGPVSLGTCVSVLIHGLPAARVGDLGTALSCGTFTPPFEISTGSSKVFIAGARAARVLDFTRHCGTVALPTKAPTVATLAVELIASTALDAIGVRAEELAANTSRSRSEHAAEDAAAAQNSALAATLRAQSHGHALAAAMHSSQASASTAAMFARLLVGKDPGLPQCVGTLTTGHADVLIGGLPLPASLELIKLGITKPLALVTRNGKLLAAFKQLLRGIPTHGRNNNALPQNLCVLTGHPVDVVTGSLVFTTCDLDLPGAPALRLERHYSSTWSERDSPLGHGWSHSLDEAVWKEHDQLIYRAEDGRELELPLPTTAEPHFVPLHRLTLRRLEDGQWQICDHHGLTRRFAAIAGDATKARLITRQDRLGRTLQLHYDDQARLTAARTGDGREIRLHYQSHRLARIDLPDPDPGSTRFVPHVRFVHDHGDLREIHDALGQITRYRHHHHRIIEETLPGGLRFHFAYDGDGSQAACVRTWGDGGILDHRLVFDHPRRTTLVINACNETTTYRADERGLVVEIVDPLGAVTHQHYDELLRLRQTIDPLGHITRLTYDTRGNLTRHEAPDGAVTITTYHPTLDLPQERVDPVGGVTRWSYDPQGRLLRHTDPLGRSTVHHHNLSEGTETIVHPDGRSEQLRRDLAGRTVHLLRSDGRTLTHHHDRRGQRSRSTDDHGRDETREYDLLGRLTRHHRHGELRLYTHDARGRQLRASDPRGELHCSYTGLGWLATCGSASAPPITLERDLEGRISRVAGPTGTLLRMTRDPAGRVRSTIDALGHERRYTRDLLGRVVAIRRPDGHHTRFTRDPAGRIVAVDHGDGITDHFVYRPDGALQAATRHHPGGRTTSTRRELDALGRVLREHQDEHSLTCEYDLRDRLIRLRSSLGADLRFNHDERGLSRLALPPGDFSHAPWSLHIERDRDGHELTRRLPGELLSWWHRDAHGRPQEHGLVASHPPQIYRHRRYQWTDHRLEITETARRKQSQHLPKETATIWRYVHNAAGELATATTPSGPTLCYHHDALGRRIARVRDGLCTRWLWHGDTLLHQWTHPRDVITWACEPGTPIPLARLTATARHAVVTDHLGSPLALLDERGQLAWSAELDQRGLPSPVRGDPNLCPFRHPGQLADPDTGLAHNRLREFDPGTGRYLSPDPLGLLGGLDLHAHVEDPHLESDVLGLAPDLPHGVHARIAAELVADFPLHDLPPHLAELARRSGPATDRQHGIATIYATPPRGACE